MQISQNRDGLDLPRGGDHACGLLTSGDLHRSPLAETLGGPRISEVADVLAEDAPQVSLAVGYDADGDDALDPDEVAQSSVVLLADRPEHRTAGAGQRLGVGS